MALHHDLFLTETVKKSDIVERRNYRIALHEKYQVRKDGAEDTTAILVIFRALSLSEIFYRQWDRHLSGLVRMRANANRNEFKVVLLGSAGVGKTSIVTRMSKNIFSRSMQSTIGVSFAQCDIDTPLGLAELNVWDTGGSEKYRALAPMYYRNADFAIIVYSLQNDHSLSDAEYWVTQVRENGVPGIPICLCANKCDGVQDGQDSDEKRSEVVSRLGLKIVKETSALTGSGIKDLFHEVAMTVLQKQRIQKKGPKIEDRKSPSSCC
jgi:small GTP-binding protein